MVSLARGPMVYCTEKTDHGVPLSALSLPENAEIRAVKREEGILKDILLLQAEGLRQDLPKSLYETTDRQFQSCTIHAIPYFAWGNREQGDMCVWIREEP